MSEPAAFPATTAISSWHAHIYFDAARRDPAWTLRGSIEAALSGIVAIGSFHERSVGPHPAWSFQLAFAPEHLAVVIAWLALNHGELDVFIHPNTGDELRDHRDSAIWIGRSYDLNLAALGP
ncbi:MAG: DOPA 4,5-dioxygenase family protein [Casimicrobiaceae bacterium]